VIQKEVAHLVEDVVRLDERVDSLQKHFDQANNDIGLIRKSTEKVRKRSDRIIEAELDGGPAEIAATPRKTIVAAE
jgi:DNA recombination protein RmuC